MVKQLVSDSVNQLALLMNIFKYRGHIRGLPKSFRAYVSELPPKAVVVDVGANVGHVSRFLASRGLMVHAFEPGNRASAELRLVAKKYSNVTVYPVAAGVTDGYSKLYLHFSEKTSRQDLTQASSLLSDKPNVDETNYEIVKTIDFVRFLDSLSARVSLIKIDIEGFEIELVNHLLDSGCLERIDKIFVETHEKKWPSMRVPTLLLKNRVREMNLEDKIRFDWT